MVCTVDYLVVKIDAKQIEILDRFDLPGYMQIDDNNKDEDHWLGSISNDGKRIILHRYKESRVSLKRQTKSDDTTELGFKRTRVKHWLNPIWVRVGGIVR